MESEAQKTVYKLNDNVSASVEYKREKGHFKNKITVVFEKTDGAPWQFLDKQALRDFVGGLDLEDNQTNLLDDLPEDDDKEK